MRTELPQLIDLAQRLLDRNEPGTVATLFAADGSSYRSLGATMVAGPPGMVAGGVSGGCLEDYIVRNGREMVRDRDAVLQRFSTGSGDDVADAKPAPGCGGTIEVLIERLTPDHLQHLRRLAEAYDGDLPSLATCTIESTRDGGVAVTRRWGRPEDGDPTAALARRALRDCRGYCGMVRGSTRALVQYVPAMTRLVVFGAGDDVRPLCDIARSLGWHVTVADRSARRARPDRFPSVDAVVAAPWPAAVEQVRFTANTAIVLMTHSLPDDAILLPLLADKAFAYAGVLGPAHRRDALVAFVRETDALPESFVARLRGPIGLDIGDRSAAGIAVSVVAEILAELNRRDAGAMSPPPPPRRTLSLSTTHA